MHELKFNPLSSSRGVRRRKRSGAGEDRMLPDFIGRWWALRSYRRGVAAWQAGDYARAEALGRRAIKLRYSGGYEVLALALRETERVDEAHRILEQEGIVRAPNAWSLWKLIGDCRSDLGRYDEALIAYDRAAACEVTKLENVELNRAIVLTRAGRLEDSLLAARRAREAGAEAAVAIEAGCLARLGRWDDAEAVARVFEPNASNDQDSAGTWAAIAEAALEAGRKGDARRLAEKAVSIRFVRPAGLVLRELGPGPSEHARYFRLLLQGGGDWGPRLDANGTPAGAGPKGFFSTVDVVADSAEEALEFARLVFPEHARASLKIDSVEVLGPRADDPKGVYTMTGYAFFLE